MKIYIATMPYFDCILTDEKGRPAALPKRERSLLRATSAGALDIFSFFRMDAVELDSETILKECIIFNTAPTVRYATKYRYRTKQITDQLRLTCLVRVPQI